MKERVRGRQTAWLLGRSAAVGLACPLVAIRIHEPYCAVNLAGLEPNRAGSPVSKNFRRTVCVRCQSNADSTGMKHTHAHIGSKR